MPCRFPAFHGGERMVGAVSKHRGWWPDSGGSPPRKRGWEVRLFPGSVRSDNGTREGGERGQRLESRKTLARAAIPSQKGTLSGALVIFLYPFMSARDPKSIPGGASKRHGRIHGSIGVQEPSKFNGRSAARAITLFAHTLEAVCALPSLVHFRCLPALAESNPSFTAEKPLSQEWCSLPWED